MKNLLILIIALFSFTVADAQIVDRTKDKAKGKATNRVDSKIDNGIDKSLDAIEGIFKKKDKDKKKDKSSDQTTQETSTSSETKTQADYSGFFGGGKPIDMESSYGFDHQVLMQMTTYDKKGKASESMNMTMLFAEDAPSMGIEMAMEGAQSYVVMDMERQKSVVLTNMEGMKIAMEVDLDPSMYETEEVDMEAEAMPSFTKTGKTKKIAGYNCEQYVFSDEEMDGETWVTDEVELDMYKGLMAMSGTKKQETQLPEGFPAGMMMETTSTDKKSGEKMVMVVTDIQMNNRKSISTEGYQSMGFGGK